MITANNMRWAILKNFETQWKALNDKKKEDKPDTPKLNKGTTVMKWSEAFKDHLHRIVGARCIPLAYVVRDNIERENPLPVQANGLPHSGTHGSVEADLIRNATHDDPLYRNDNESVYMELETATRNTQYAAAIAPHQRAKDGRAGFLALISQFAGVSKWEAELKAKEAIMHSWKWKGNHNY